MFFAILNFTLSGAIGLVGILTLRKVSVANEILFASLPLLFALHQFTEGFVWLGINNLIDPQIFNLASEIFIFYAQGLLPFIVPSAIWLIEPSGFRRKIIYILMLMGGILALYTIWGLVNVPTSVSIVDETLYYVNPWTNNYYDAAVYILTTCGSLMLSRSISIQLFGWLNFIGLSFILIFKPYGLTSLWCLYAATISGLLYFYFIERRIKFLQDIKYKEKNFSEKLNKELNSLLRKRLLFIKKN